MQFIIALKKLITMKFNNQKYEHSFNDGDINVIKLNKGLNEEVIKTISNLKQEDDWLIKSRLDAYDVFNNKKNPTWGPDLSFINFNEYTYYVKPSEKMVNDWNDVPEKIRSTFQKLKIPENEAKFLNGVATQYDSEMVYHSLLKELEEKQVIFTDPNTAAKQYPDLFKKYFGKLVPPTDNKYAALNTAVWSGGTFIYVPKNVKIEKPLQSYFRINSKSAGQFERTLIIVDEGASVHYIEGCTAPIYDKNNLHAAVVEVFVHKNATCRYTTIQNWSDNVLNLVTKRAICYENGKMSWIDGNLGSQINMKYPATILFGDNSASECISVAVAGKNVIQDAGAKMIHVGKNTKSKIISKGVSFNNGRNIYRGLVKIGPQATNAISFVECDTLLLNDESSSDAFPTEILENDSSSISHEAVISKISNEQLFYLMSKGFSKEKAENLIVIGFLNEFSNELPMEYAVELNQLIKLDMDR